MFGINGGNFVKTMLRLADSHDSLTVVDDQTGSPTYTPDLARLICDMIKTEKYGTYHASNEGFCTWAQFAKEIMRQAGKTAEIVPCTTEQYPAKAKRPKIRDFQRNASTTRASTVCPRGRMRSQDFSKSLI